tara:strand:- start:1096 stop:1761 length:666 start_codon:yes stop_codon:yes gene_type:complete
MATTSLTNTNISDTYVGVLHAKGTTIPASGLEYVYDGFGNKSGLKIGQAGNGISADGPVDGTALGDTLLAAIVDRIFPVGAIYITTNSDNPQTTFGGTWEQTAQGKFIAGVGIGTDTQNAQREVVAGDNGVTEGRYNHVLNTIELPSHTHDNIHPTTGQQFHTVTRAAGTNTSPSDVSEVPADTNAAGKQFQWTGIGYTGEDVPHNNTPPGYGMYIWKRTA